MFDAGIHSKNGFLPTVQQVWLLLSGLVTLQIAGPWVPLGLDDNEKLRGVGRYSASRHLIAQAIKQSDIAKEDARLISLGWFLTDNDRSVPENWFP